MPLPALRERRRAVNVIDQARALRFSFGAIVNRSPLVIGISTDGAAPVLRTGRSAPSSKP